MPLNQVARQVLEPGAGTRPQGPAQGPETMIDRERLYGSMPWMVAPSDGRSAGPGHHPSTIQVEGRGARGRRRTHGATAAAAVASSFPPHQKKLWGA